MRIGTAIVATVMALSLAAPAFAQGAPGGGGSGGNEQSEPDKGTSKAGGAMKTDDGSMGKEGGAMKKGDSSGQEATPAEPTPKR